MKVNFSNSPTCSSWILEEVGKKSREADETFTSCLWFGNESYLLQLANLLLVDLRRGGRKKVRRRTKLSLHVCGFELKVNNWPTCSSWILEEVGDSATWFHSVSNVKTRSPTVTFTWVLPSPSHEDLTTH